MSDKKNQEHTPKIENPPNSSLENTDSQPLLRNNPDYDPYELPYIESRKAFVQKKSYVGYGIAYAQDKYEEILSDEDRIRIKKHFRLGIVLLLLWIVFIIWTMPPYHRSYQGETGTFHFYHYKTTVITPKGQSVSYTRSAYNQNYYYTLTYPQGETFTISTAVPNLRTYYMLQTDPVTQVDLDIFQGLLAVENFNMSESSMESLGIMLISVPYFLFGGFCLFFPYHMAEVAAFCYVTWGIYGQTDQFIRQCRLFGLIFILFMATPWGQEFSYGIFLFLFKLVFGGWLSAFGVSL